MERSVNICKLQANQYKLEDGESKFVGCRKQIFSGRTTRIWGDRWIPKPPSFTSISSTSRLPRDSTVNLLFDASRSHWNVALVNDIFPADEARMILQLPVSRAARNDKWVWHFTKSGKFTVKSAYHTILQHPAAFPESHTLGSSSSGPDPIWKKIWKFKIPNRILHFAWRFLTNSLPSASNLERRGIVSHHICPLCNSSDSSLAHLFFVCQFSDAMWYAAGLQGLIRSFAHPVADIWARTLLVNSPPHIGELFLALCNAIWYSRNSKIFEDRLAQPSILVAGVFNTLHSFHQANSWPERATLSSNSSIFDKAPRGVHILFDGAISFTRNCAGIGVFVRDESGNFLRGLAKNFEGITDPFTAESLALREALILAQELNLPAISILGDSISVLLAAKNDSDADPAGLSIFEDIWSTLSSCSSINLYWISRNFNSTAHEIAQYAKHSNAVTTSWDTPPNFLYQSMLDVFQQ